jgi:hypothetical protein
VADILDARLRCMSYFFSSVFYNMSSFGCRLVYLVSSILAKRHSYAENRHRWNSCNSKGSRINKLYNRAVIGGKASSSNRHGSGLVSG